MHRFSFLSPTGHVRMVHVSDGVSATHSLYLVFLQGVRSADREKVPLPCVVFLPSGLV